jgi:uncharacterized membrane protein YfcA
MFEIDSLYLILVGLAFVAGFIDSIAGGGGLITIPALTLVMGLSAQTIGTNKIAATAAAGFAFLVYWRKGFFKLNKGVLFSIFIALGSFAGSQVAPHLPKIYFKYFLIVSAPLIIWIIFKRSFWLARAQETHLDSRHSQNILLGLSGFLCGFYDGLWGPGGGTFMLLALLVVANLPIMTAIAISKFANLVSALSSLGGYALQGLVVWKIGIYVFVPATIGAILGAQLASKQAEKIVRPILVVVVLLLLMKIYFE